jgi:hypothetical protein
LNPQIFPYQEGSIESPISRAGEMRRDNDLVKVPKITLYDIDYSVFFQLSQVMNVQLNDNGTMIPVPVIFANAEKWAQIRQHGYMRDIEKKAMAPAMVLRRTGVTQDDRIAKLDLNHYAPGIKMYPYRTFNMQYDRISGQLQSFPSYEYYTVSAPDYVRVAYELIVWTDLMEQMNEVIQAINIMDGHVWGDYYKFRTTVQDITHNTVNAPGDDRLVKSTLTLQTDGFLRQDFEYHQSNLQKQYSIKRVKFLAEESDHSYFQPINDSDASDVHFTDQPLSELEENPRRNLRYR